MVLMPMAATFRRSRVRLLPLLAALAVAASLLPMRKAMGAKPPLAVVKGSVDKTLHEFNYWLGHMKEGGQFWYDHHDNIKEQLQLLKPGARGNSPPGGTVGYVIDTGNQRFSVSGIDIDSPVTRTGKCDASGRAVSCSALPCRQLYGGKPSPNCATGAELCGDPQGGHFLLQQGRATLLSGPASMSVLSLYACSLMSSPSTGGAVLGLARTGALARTLGSFSYVLSDRQAGAFWLWLGGATAQQGQGTPTPLIANPVHPDRYYVHITSMLVDGLPLQIPLGALDIRQRDGSGGVYLSTTMPIGMVLQREVYELLTAALQNSLGTPDANSPWPCYFAGARRATTVLPTITLVFAGNAVMALQPAGPGSSVWYTRRDGAQCLAVVPSPIGETVLGTRVQMGRRMTYELAAAAGFGTVKF